MRQGNSKSRVTSSPTTGMKDCEQLEKAVSEGSISEVKRLMALSTDSLKKARLLHQGGGAVFKIAISNGDLEMLKYLIELITDQQKREEVIQACDCYVIGVAAMNGRLDILKYLLEITPIPIKKEILKDRIFEAFRQAILNNHLHIVQYLMGLVPDPETRDIIIAALPLKKDIETIEYLLATATSSKALILAKREITPFIAIQAVHRRALHTLWYSLDCPVSEYITAGMKIGMRNNPSTLIYFSFLLATERLIGQLKLEPMDQTIVTSLNIMNIPPVVKDSDYKSLLILDIMLVPIIYMHGVCNNSSRFSLLKLPKELRDKILWYTISDGITNLIPEPDCCFSIFISLSSFYSELKEDRITLKLNDDSISKYNIAYNLSFLYAFEQYISNSLKKPSLNQY